MSEGRNAELDLDVLMRRIRDDVARRKVAAGRASAGTDPVPAGAARNAATALLKTMAPLRLPESGGSIARKDRYELADLLAFHDEDFVRNAYRGILRREPDGGGFAAFLEALRHGRMAKAEVLGRMRFSAEGRAVAVPVRGLPLAFALRSAHRVPVLGRILGIIQYLFLLPDIVRNHERLEAAFFQRQFELNGQINTAEAATVTRAAALERSVDTIANAVERKVERVELDALDQRLTEVATTAAPRSEVETRFVAVERALQFKADSDNLTRLANRMLEQLEQRPEKSDFDALSGRMAEDLQAMRAALDALASGKADALDFADVVASVREQERRFAVLIEEARDRYRERVSGAEPAALAREEAHLFDAFYAAFENRFRGTPAAIKQRVAVYLPIIQEAHAGTADAPVLDIGCGRGEWLDLLKENGLEARGIDFNRVTVEQCRKRGLDVAEGDAIEYLRRLGEDSLGAVTAMHVIEHIPFRRLVMLFDEVIRALRPGAVAIFETPNPENVLVGACNFYYDPTHERPLPPEPTRFFAESRGFVDVSILPLHPVPESLPLADGDPAVRELINRVLYGAQDYALIARKPKR